MATPFIDLQAQHGPLRDELDRAIARVLDSGRFIGGPSVERFEREIAEYVGVAHAIGVSSGSDALLASLLALEVGPGDEVITTPFTFCASAEAILRVGATPVFVDIDPATFNLRADALEEAVTEKTRAILPVHLYGQCCRMDRILEVARRHDLVVVEDCAQAMGATFDDKIAGSMGTVGCFSFFPTKNLGGMGDGGMITTDDDRLAERIRIICRHGCEPKHHQRIVGGNFRLDALQAAVLRVKLGHLDDWIAKRRANAALYDEALSVVGGLVTPVEEKRRRHTYNQYTVRVADRAPLLGQLEAADIGHGVYYRMPLHRQDAYADARTVGSLEAAERACREVVSLPVAVDSVEEVIETLLAA
ncbi:MAG: DegT/DnrJ/EryC1/StrS family aminotransferase [Persicimonas sp.]